MASPHYVVFEFFKAAPHVGLASWIIQFVQHFFVDYYDYSITDCLRKQLIVDDVEILLSSHQEWSGKPDDSFALSAVVEKDINFAIIIASVDSLLSLLKCASVKIAIAKARGCETNVGTSTRRGNGSPHLMRELLKRSRSMIRIRVESELIIPQMYSENCFSALPRDVLIMLLGYLSDEHLRHLSESSSFFYRMHLLKDNTASDVDWDCLASDVYTCCQIKPDIPIFAIINKLDIDEKSLHQFSLEEAASFGIELGLSDVFFVSSKTRLNIDESMAQMIRYVLKGHLKFKDIPGKRKCNLF